MCKTGMRSLLHLYHLRAAEAAEGGVGGLVGAAYVPDRAHVGYLVPVRRANTSCTSPRCLLGCMVRHRQAGFEIVHGMSDRRDIDGYFLLEAVRVPRP